MAQQASTSLHRHLRGRSAAVLFAVFAGSFFFAALVRAITATLAPTLVRELSLGPGTLGLLTGALFVGYAITQLPLGRWLDRHGPTRVLAASLGLAVAGCLAFALADGLASLALARVIMGIGLSASLMAPLTAFRLWYEPAAQLRANSWILMSGALGSLASTLPVQMLLPVIGWRGVFLVLALVFSLAICAILGLAPKDTARLPGAPRADSAGGYREVWRQPTFRAYAGIAFINYAGLMAMQTLWIGPWLVNVAGHTPDEAAMGLFLVNGCLLAAFLAWGFAMPRLTRTGWPSQRLIAWGTPLTIVMLAWIAVAGPAATAWLWALFCVSCTFMSLAQPLVARSFPEELAGRALSAYNLLLLAGVFVLQWGIGMAIDLLKSLGLETVHAYRGAIALYGAVALASYLLHVRKYRSGCITEFRTPRAAGVATEKA